MVQIGCFVLGQSPFMQQGSGRWPRPKRGALWSVPLPSSASEPLGALRGPGQEVRLAPQAPHPRPRRRVLSGNSASRRREPSGSAGARQSGGWTQKGCVVVLRFGPPKHGALSFSFVLANPLNQPKRGGKPTQQKRRAPNPLRTS